MKKYKETAVIEFYKKGEDIYAEYNDVRMTLTSFLSLAKKDIDVAKALLAIQKKMKKLNYKKDIFSFIDTHFRFNNNHPDIIVRNGSNNSDSFVTFDDKEIELGQKVLVNENVSLYYINESEDDINYLDIKVLLNILDNNLNYNYDIALDNMGFSSLQELKEFIINNTIDIVKLEDLENNIIYIDNYYIRIYNGYFIIANNEYVLSLFE
jgi:hypothetical protein